MDPTAQILIAVLGGGGATAIATVLIKGIITMLNGSASREREKNTSIEAQRIRAIEERDLANEDRDEEARLRRTAENLAAGYYQLLVKNGITPGEWVLDRTVPKIPTTKEK